jgi:nanoRNase/pAp phosphatase (c-di-AMP/oligoRNAs hydrolase)
MYPGTLPAVSPAVAWWVAQSGVELLLRRRPGLVLAVGLAVLVGTVVAVAAVRHYLRTPADRLCKALGAVEEVTVLMHPNPDPDAMAAALGIQRLAESVGTAANVQYSGRIRHEENRAMVRALGLEFSRFEDISALRADHVVLVDHNEARGFAGAGGLSPYAVVDHHPGGGQGERFTDVRPEYGSCAAIVAEYLRDRGWKPDDREKPLSRDLATALLYGIQADTSDFSRGCTNADFDAAAFVFPAVKAAVLDSIANPPVDEEALEIRARAVQYRRKSGPHLCSFVGEVENADALGQAADELLRLEGITAVVVGGEVGGTLHLSGRSTDDGIDVGQALREAVADIPMANAGGHRRMGGGQLSIEHMRGLGPSSGVSEDELRERVFAALAGE